MKVLIAEDDILIAEYLHDIIEECDIETIHVAHNFEDILFQIKTQKPDLVLLDIHIDEHLTGIKIAKELNENYKIPFIYITAQSDKAVMNLAIETKPLGYIIKPFNSNEVYASIQLAKKICALKFLFVKDIYGNVKIEFDTIKYVKADGNYLEIHTTERKIIIRSTISSFLELLPTANFMHVQRSFIVNTKRIERMDSTKIFFNDTSITFSKNKMAEIKSKLL